MLYCIHSPGRPYSLIDTPTLPGQECFRFMPKGIYQHRPHSKETKRKISESHIGIKNHNFGKHPSAETRQKLIMARKKKIGDKSPNWKGDAVGYYGLHVWIYKRLGSPIDCKHCGKIGEKINGQWNIDWANKDHKYKRDTEDWIGLCSACHMKYDSEKRMRMISSS